MNRQGCKFCGSALTALSAASKCGSCGLHVDRTTGRPIWRFTQEEKETKTVTL